MDFKILRYMQPAHVTIMQYADDFYAKSYKVADIDDESTLNDIFIEGVHLFISCSLLEYWATHLQADVINIAFKTQ